MTKLSKLSKLASSALLMPLMVACGTTATDDGGNGGNDGVAYAGTLADGNYSGAATKLEDGAQYLTSATQAADMISLTGRLLDENGNPASTDTDFSASADGTVSYSYAANPGDVLGADYTFVEFYNVIDSDNNPVYSGYHGIATETTDIPSENVAIYGGVWVGTTAQITTDSFGVMTEQPLLNEGGTTSITANFGGGHVLVALTDTPDTGLDYGTLVVSGLGISGNAFSSGLPIGTATTPTAVVSSSGGTHSGDLLGGAQLTFAAGGHFYGTDDAINGLLPGVTGPDEVAGGLSISSSLTDLNTAVTTTTILTGVFFGD